MSEHDTNTNEAPAAKKDAGFLSSIDGTLLSRFAAIALLTSLLLGGLVFMSMRSLTSAANDAVVVADGLDENGAAALDALADQVNSTSSRVLMFIVAVAVVSVVLAVIMSRATAKRVVAPMVELRDAARATSGALPAFVQACEAGDGKVPGLPIVDVKAGGVTADIAASFNELQRNAANLVVTQTFRRGRDGGRFVDLGRSTEQLLNDQMRFIEAMEHDETSAANLQRLFRIDHLASRMRRNAASMLVLADRDTPRQFSRPVSIHQVVQAASSGIEHFERVSMTDLSGIAVNGAIAADLAHLLAEVLESATVHSAESITDVSGQPTADGFTVAVTDGGSPFGPAELAAINQCLADPRIADAKPTTAMTHAVIARLAARHDVRVEMQPLSDGGIVTQIHLPQIALARMTAANATPATPSANRTEAAEPIAAPPQMPAETPAPDSLDDDSFASPPVADVVDRVATAPVDADLHDHQAPDYDEPEHHQPEYDQPEYDQSEYDQSEYDEPEYDQSGHEEQPQQSASQDVFAELTAEPAPAEHAPAAATSEPVATVESVFGESVSGEPAVAEPAAPEPESAASAADAEAAALAERWRVLASGQRAAIEWAMDVDSRSQAGATTALRPGPVDAATLAELDASSPIEG